MASSNHLGGNRLLSGLAGFAGAAAVILTLAWLTGLLSSRDMTAAVTLLAYTLPAGLLVGAIGLKRLWVALLLGVAFGALTAAILFAVAIAQR